MPESHSAPNGDVSTSEAGAASDIAVLAKAIDSASDDISHFESPGRTMLRSWLNKNMKMKLSDGRVLIGIFLCTDRDANVILGSCAEYLSEPTSSQEEPRILGLAMVPGKHIVTIHVDDANYHQ